MTRIEGRAPGLAGGGLDGVSDPAPRAKTDTGAPAAPPPAPETGAGGPVTFQRSPRHAGVAWTGKLDTSRLDAADTAAPGTEGARPPAREALMGGIPGVADAIQREKVVGVPNGATTWSSVGATRLGAVLAGVLIGPDGKIDAKAVTDLRAEIGLELARVKDGHEPTQRKALGDILCRSNLELLDRQLGQLEKNPALAATLNGIGAPARRSEGLARLALGLPHDAPVTATDGRKAALAAMLTPLRQGSAGSCFGTSIAVMVQSQRPDLMAADLKDMIEKGYLTRRQNGVDIPIPMSTMTALEEFRRPVPLNETGEPSAALLQAPGVGEALTALGIPEKDWAKSLAAGVRAAAASGQPVTLEAAFGQIVQAQVRAGSQAPLSDAQLRQARERLSLAADQFMARTENRLLRAWEFTVSAMAERGALTGVRKEITETLFNRATRTITDTDPATGQTVSRQWTGLGLDAKLDDLQLPPDLDAKVKADTLKARLIDGFTVTLNERMALHYDASITKREKSADGNSSYGGFVMYDAKGAAPGELGKRIANAQDFKAFIVSILDEARSGLVKGAGSDADRQALEYFGAELAAHAGSDAFVEHTLRSLGDHDKEPNVLARQDTLKRPWEYHEGNFPNRVLSLYFGWPKEIFAELQAKQPVGAQGSIADHAQVRGEIKRSTDILKFAIDALRKVGPSVTDQVKANSGFMMPMVGGPHAFLLTPGAQPLYGMWTSGQSVDAAITEKLIAPGQAQASTPLSLEQARKLADGAAGSLGLGSGTAEAWDQFTKKVLDGAANLSPKALHQAVERAAAEHLGKSNIPAAKRDEALRSTLNALDTEMYNTLPQRVGIAFADTNWGNGGEPQRFSIIFNPGTGQPELWATAPDGKLLSSNDTPEWYGGPKSKTWEIVADPRYFGGPSRSA